jgi:hypothetical protein
MTSPLAFHIVFMIQDRPIGKYPDRANGISARRVRRAIVRIAIGARRCLPGRHKLKLSLSWLFPIVGVSLAAFRGGLNVAAIRPQPGDRFSSVKIDAVSNLHRQG